MCIRDSIWADDHKMLIVNLQIWLCTKQCFDKLVYTRNALKSITWNCVLNTCIMSIKSNDVGYTHFCKFLKSHSAVKRLAGSTLVLAAFIQEWHDYIDTACLAFNSSNDTPVSYTHLDVYKRQRPKRTT